MEAALVLPIALFCFLTFIYFIQIITIQEHIQEAITKTGLKLAKYAYVYEDFTGAEDLAVFDFNLFGEEYELELSEMAEAVTGEAVIKGLLRNELDIKQINRSCIRGGFNDISFYYSRILEDDSVDIVARYRMCFPISFFGLGDLRMIQRVRLRAWTGHRVDARYTIIKESSVPKGSDTKEGVVYITETGTVYHSNKNCSHISISIEEVKGLLSEKRNAGGGKYYPCENCCGKEVSSTTAYYITRYGDRYHTLRDCSSIKRTVREVTLSEASDRQPCKRCGQ